MNALTDPSAFSEDAKAQSLNDEFKKVKKLANHFENAEDNAEFALNDALASIYKFGANLLGPIENPDEDTAFLFFKANGVKLNAPKRRNPFIALTELAFEKSSPSLRSQRAKILSFARISCVPAKDFKGWISEDGGLKGRLKEATAFFGGTAHDNNNRERESRLDRAKDYLNNLPSLADFNIANVPDGFAIILARVADGQAQAVNVLAHELHEIAKLEAAIVPFDPSGPARRSLLATLPLGPLWRAVDMIFLATGGKQSGHIRSIAFRNITRNGDPVCEVLSVSAARDEATAIVEITGHVGALPLDQYFVLYSAVKTAEAGYGSEGAAELFHSAFAEHHNWEVQRTKIIADNLPLPINLVALPSTHAFRVADALPSTTKTFSITLDGCKALIAYLDAEAERAKPSRGAKQVLPMAELMEMEDRQGDFCIRSVGSPNEVTIGTTTHVLDPETRDLAYADMQRVARCLAAYEVGASGAFLDGQTHDACLRFEVTVGSDKLAITIPTRSGEARSRFRVPLEAA